MQIISYFVRNRILRHIVTGKRFRFAFLNQRSNFHAEQNARITL